jgi:3-phosphoshikimate 1-carboxyvinyltransferase
MAKLLVKPATGLKASFPVPGDKSISHRAIMIGSLAKGETTVNNFLGSADCLATVECFRRMGIKITAHGTRLIIDGKGLKGLKQPAKPLYAGNSGTTVRLLSGILAGQDWPVEISGDESIQKRPMGRIARPLREMGANIEGRGSGDEVFPPLKIHGGELKPITYDLPVASAQVKSAILLAGLFADGETSVIEKTQSRDHTERMLEHFGAAFKVAGGKLQVTGSKQFAGAMVDVPGDISSAAFFLVAGLIVSHTELRLLNVGVNPTRTGIIDVLHRMGGDLTIQNERLLSEEPQAEIIVRTSKLKGIKIDGSIIPRIIDEIPIIAVAATQAEGVTEIRGARELRVKESDRIKTVASELRKMGAQIEEFEDGLKITGPTKLKGAKIESYGDHRIAMAAAIAGLAADGQTEINNTDCITTSFPGFEQLLNETRV